jgi:hypothetical protein
MKVLALMLDNAWMRRVGNVIIKPEYFESDDEEAFAKAILQYRETYGRSPKDPADTIHICGGKHSTFILDVYELYEEGDDLLDLVKDVVIQFAKEQAAKIAILESVEDIKVGNMAKPIERMKSALKVGEELLSPGLDPIRDIDKWLYNYWEDKVRTGLVHVDHVLEGGLNKGEEGIVLAPPNRGKSMMLINIGYGAATIGSGKHVVHFTHEMSVEQTAKRYAARMLFRFPKPEDNLDEYAEEIVVAARKLLTGKIRIIGGSASTRSIESHLEQLASEDDFELGLIIDDYLDKVYPPKDYADRRFELSALYDWFRNLCEHYQVPGWSASQSGRNSLSKEIITMQDVAEDIGKANIADVIVALCQTYDEVQIDQCRLFMAKVRDASKKQGLIQAKYYGGSQAIVTTGFIDINKDKKDV